MGDLCPLHFLISEKIMMKKLLLLFVILLFSSFVYSFDFGVSLSLRTAKDNSKFDYQFSSEIEIKDRLNAEIEIERENGKHYLNYITELFQKGHHYVVSTKRTYIQCRSIDQIYLEALGRYSIQQTKWKLFLIKYITNGWWNLGIRQEWNLGLPSTNIVIGKSFKKELFFFLMPADIEYKTEFISSNFKKWDNESFCKISFSFVTFIDYYLKYIVRENYFQMKMGLMLKL